MTVYTQASLARLPLKDKKTLQARAQREYQQTTGQPPIMEDALYDYLVALIKQEDPKWAKGIPVESPRPKIEKKFERAPGRKMGSLDKFYPEDFDAFLRWKSSFHTDELFILSDKLDGAALLAESDGGGGVWDRLTTRGSKAVDGFLTYIPENVLPRPPTDFPGALRMEAVVPYEIWEAKYKEEFKDPRVMAAAVFNRLDVHPSIACGDVKLMVLRSWGFGYETAPMSSVFTVLMEKGFGVVPHSVVDHASLTIERLEEELEEARGSSLFNLDGLVVCLDAPEGELDDSYKDCPDWAKAFKVNALPVDATIDFIEWRTTRTGRVVPRIHIVPVRYGGVTVTHATANNASWIVERKIEKGAVVKILRGGEIIPKIVEVVTGVDTVLPTAESLGVGAIGWDANHTDLVVTDFGEKVSRQRAQALNHMLVSVGVKGLAIAACEKMAHDPDINPMNMLDLLYTEGGADYLVGLGVSAKILQTVVAGLPEEVALHDLMKGSGIFGRGMGEGQLSKITKLKPVSVTPMPEGGFDRLDYNPQQVLTAVGPVAAQKYISSCTEFWDQLSDLIGLRGIIVLKKSSTASAATGVLAGKKVSFTGYRDESQEAAIRAAGGEVVKFGLTTTNILLFSPVGKASSKVQTAANKGITVTTFDKLGI